MDKYLAATSMCDVNHPHIQSLSSSIAAQEPSARRRAVLAFQQAQNAVLYRVGLHNDTSSATLCRGFGSCSNKANVLVALLRALGIPAGFGEILVNGKDYLLWPTPAFRSSIERCKTLLSEFQASTRHFFVLVYLDGRWLRCDPSDDLKLAHGGKHCLRTLQPVVFDGQSDACLAINPADILADWAPSREPMPDIDEHLMKKQRAPPLRVQIINFGLEFIRDHGLEVASQPPKAQIHACWRHIAKALRNAHAGNSILLLLTSATTGFTAKL